MLKTVAQNKQFYSEFIEPEERLMFFTECIRNFIYRMPANIVQEFCANLINDWLNKENSTKQNEKNEKDIFDQSQQQIEKVVEKEVAQPIIKQNLKQNRDVKMFDMSPRLMTTPRQNIQMIKSPKYVVKSPRRMQSS